MATRFLFICITFLFASSLCFGQRPKIGLTLSGGGAKGLAHVGILKAIDKAGLKVDYITGTSMGSIVGAMYAAGYSGEQIEEITNGIDWDVMLSGKPLYKSVSLDEKDEYDNYSVNIPFEGFKPALSTGLIESEEIWLKFSEIFFPVHQIKDFSKFNIPFKCIATDVETGKAVVLDKGEIVWAVRSSMAIPSVFSAVDYKDTKLVDGGIVRNFPVKDVRAMGADFVIGVNLFSGLSKAEDLTSALDVMYQITNYRDAEDLVQEKKLCNVLIEPELANYSAGSFSSVDEITKIGNDLGEKYYPYFKQLADSLNNLQKVEFDPNGRLPKKEAVIIDEIKISGIVNTSESMLKQNLEIKEGDAYLPEDLNFRFRRAYSTLYYDNVYYELIPTTPGHCILKCTVNEAKMNQLKIGFASHTFNGTALYLNFTMRNLLFDKSRTVMKIAAGENWRFLASHRQAFGKNLNGFVEGALTGDKFLTPFYDKATLNYTYNTKLFKLNLEYYNLLNNNWGYGIGGGRSLHYFTRDVSTLDINKAEYTFNHLTARVHHNSINKKFFATKGNIFSFNAQMRNNRYSEREYSNDSIVGAKIKTVLSQFTISGEFRQPLSARLTIKENVDLGYTVNDEANLVSDKYMFGGGRKYGMNFIPFMGINEGQVYTNSHTALTLGLQYKTIGELYTLFNTSSMLYNFDENFDVTKNNQENFLLGFGAGVGYNLSALPLQLLISYSPQIGKFYTNVAIGFMF